MDHFIRYFSNRLNETSTWRNAIVLLFGLAGYNLSAEEATTLMAAGMIIKGIIGMAFPDKIKP